MNLFNKKILNQRIANYSFPTAGKAEDISKLIIGWQKALKDSDLSKTKEKSIQGKFLSVFFEQILGYQDKTSGTDQWTLVAEPKTEVDAQTADGAIGFFSKDENLTVGAIELKDAKTSLDKKQKGREKGYSPVEQAYMYATKFDRCKWIIVSNFREIRLYNKARSEQFFEKFDVLELHKEEEFRKFYFLLSKENLIAKEGESPIDDLVKKSEATEEDISKHFYTDYKSARQDLYKHLVEFNSNIDKKTLFEKSQKILDRTVFILFCEDTANLLPKNILKDTYQLGVKSRDRNDEKVWREMKNLFIDIDEGRSDIDPKINGYNGGLFKYDEVLDTLVIKDGVWQTIIKLADYDFETDLNVNILGHIFEQSISDIESIKSEIEGEEQDKSKSKRKKDGIFYTPEYITKYIVENTVGKYLEEHPDKLSSIKILDPACGSGAFLNQAHSYLLNEYRVRHEQKVLEKHEKGEEMSLFDYNPAEANRAILLNNLYGVDLNDESVEITKLSLWLKTARKDEPLQNLDGNIKVGNSLIDDPLVADEKAFKWNEEFDEIMNEGGFDVIIGNPPYVKIQNLRNNYDKEVEYYRNNYQSATGKYDIYVLFIEKAFKLLKKGGVLGFILPHKFLNSDYGKGIRKFIIENKGLQELYHFDYYSVFDDATTYTCLLFLKKDNLEKFNFVHTDPLELKISGGVSMSEMDTTSLGIDKWELASSSEKQIITKVSSGKTLKDYTEGIYQGVVSMGDDIYMMKGDIKQNYFYGFSEKLNKEVKIESSIMQPILKGKDIKRYQPLTTSKYIIYPHKELDGKTMPYTPNELREQFPLTFEYLSNFKDELIEKKKRYKTNQDYWYALHRSRELEIFKQPKLLVPYIGARGEATIDKEGLLHNTKGYSLVLKDKSEDKYLELLGILNSSLCWFYIKSTATVYSGGFYTFSTKYLEKFSVPSTHSSTISENVKRILELVLTKQEAQTDAKSLLVSEYRLINANLVDSIELLGWNELIDELTKNYKDLTLSKKDELQQWFRQKQNELLSIQKEVQSLENTIDQEVYKLYDLNKEEIAVIESAI